MFVKISLFFLCTPLIFVTSSVCCTTIYVFSSAVMKISIFCTDIATFWSGHWAQRSNFCAYNLITNIFYSLLGPIPRRGLAVYGAKPLREQVCCDEGSMLSPHKRS